MRGQAKPDARRCLGGVSECLASMHPGDRCDDRETKPVIAPMVAVIFSDSVKALKDAIQLLWGNWAPRVLYLDHGVRSFAQQP